MNPVEFLKAFEFAESEIQNYKAMLKTYEQPAT